MKCTQLKRKTPLARTSSLKRTPFKRAERPNVGASPMPLSSLRQSPLKRSWMRRRPTRVKAGDDPKRRRFLSKLPCAACGRPPPTPVHHERKKTTGLALKEPDSRAMPLCDARTGVNGCHNDFHQGKGHFKNMTAAQKKAWMEETIALLQEAYVRSFGAEAELRERITG